MTRLDSRFVPLLMAALLVGCATPGSRGPLLFESAPLPTVVPPDVNWPHPPIVTLAGLRAFDRDTLSDVRVSSAGGGVTGARKVRFRLEEAGAAYTVKAKRVPGGDMDGYNNAPRREIASYQIQRLFLDPVDFVVPTSTLRCVPLEDWAQYERRRPASVPGTRCVLVNLSFWIENVTIPDTLYDPERFRREPNYAYHLAHFNLLSYLIQARDSRRGNVLVSVHEDDRRVFAIDNGISFGEWIYNWFVPSTYAWQHIRVPALPRRAVERLRLLERGDLDVLATAVHMETDETGILRLEAPKPPLDPSAGVRVGAGVVQFGLTRKELDALWKRIVRLLARIDAGEIATF